jgi:hypothetical protein
MRHRTNVPEQLFHPIEHAIICEWLGIEAPPAAKGIDIWTQIDGPEDGPITLKKDMSGNLGEFTHRNAVARLLLEGIQKHLPQWVTFYSDHTVWGREYTQKTPRKIDLLPQFLFEINWANSGPGFSWPEQYHATYLPGYHYYIVTASQDSPDAYGYEDIAVGYFEAGTPLEAGCRQVLINWWCEHGKDPERRWEAFWRPGLITEETATQWADMVWIDISEDEELGEYEQSSQ